MLASIGVEPRRDGWRHPNHKSPQQRRREPEPEQQPRPVVEIVQRAGQPLVIPCRTREERRLRRWTPAELQAIALELSAGRVVVVRRGHSAWPAGRSVREAQAAGIGFYKALQRLAA